LDGLSLLYCTSVLPVVSPLPSRFTSWPELMIVLGPLLFALLRGEFPLLWSFVDGADETEIKDDTIEAPSEAAQRAREEAKAKAVESEALLNGNEGEAEKAVVEEDDSWMDGPVGLPEDGKARKRKNKKK
jgi:hypothetical protein